MLFGIVYTPRKADGPGSYVARALRRLAPTGRLRARTGTSPPAAAWASSRRATAAELSRTLAPFAAFFAFRVEQLEAAEEVVAPTRDPVEELALA